MPSKIIRSFFVRTANQTFLYSSSNLKPLRFSHLIPFLSQTAKKITLILHINSDKDYIGRYGSVQACGGFNKLSLSLRTLHWLAPSVSVAMRKHLFCLGFFCCGVFYSFPTLGSLVYIKRVQSDFVHPYGFIENKTITSIMNLQLNLMSIGYKQIPWNRKWVTHKLLP